MNNDAFRALINKGRQSSGAEKSTKEIAREAVENEFQKKRSKRGGGGKRGRRFDDGYGSDSGGSSDEDGRGRPLDRDRDLAANKQQDDDEPDWKRRRREKKLQDGELEYRDRAKERREGKNADYSSLEGFTQSGEDDRRRQAELSKYLGGDEEHTHLVKGLDKALAEKVRREEMGGDRESTEAGDLDQLLEDSYATMHQQARKVSARPKSELGKSILSYLSEKKKSETSMASHPGETAPLTQVKSNPTIQKSLQRSILTFSLESDVRQRKKAWEVPRMSSRAFGAHENGTASRKMTPLNQHMIATISKKLDDVRSRVMERSKYDALPRGKDTNGTSRNDATNLGKDTGRENEQGNVADSSKDTKENGEPYSNASKEDSDDDIFENVGSYVPQALAPSKAKGIAASVSADASKESGKQNNATDEKNGDSGKHNDKEEIKQKPKPSIFDNLLPETAPPKPVHRPIQQTHLQTNQQKQQSSPQKKNVIDRDIFGGQQKSTETYQKRRGPQSAAMEGVSMASYQGGYGEEMDVDFGGDESEWRKKEKGDKEKGATSDTAGDQDVDEEEE